MKRTSKLVWKFTAVVVAILVVAIGVSGYVHNLIWGHYSLASAKEFLRFNSESIAWGIGQQMMSRNIEGVSDLIQGISRHNVVYRDIRLISHHSGEIVVSRSGPNSGKLELDSQACAVCHDRDNFADDPPKTVELVSGDSTGNRELIVMTPILKEPRCGAADCHVHADDPPILGFVNADYSLQPMDAAVAERKSRVVLIIFASLLLGVSASLVTFRLLLERPIRKLIDGTKRIAARQLDFRFERKRNDEFGLLEESFNAMTATIQASQDELRDAKEYLEGMVEHTADIIITVNSEGLIETLNRGGEEALGYRREEVIGKPIESLYVDPRERPRLDANGSVKNYETRLRGKDGQIRTVLLTLSRLRDSEGRSIGTIGISKDITQEKELQDQLRNAKDYLEGMVEHSADIIITVNSEGLIETFNRGGEEALGYRREEVIGKPIESLYVDPRERHVAADQLEKTGNVKNYETRLRAKDGGIRHVLLTLSWRRDSEGKPIGTIGISKDISHRMKLRDELRDAKEHLEGIIENSADIIITVTPDGAIQTFNRGAEQALGYARREVIGKPIETLFADPRERAAAIARLKDAEAVRNYETRFLAKNGQVRDVLLTLSLLRDSRGEPVGTIGISKDITQEKKLQRELVQSQKFAAIGQAVTGIQHAIKNMLNALKGGAYLVQNGIRKGNRERVKEGLEMVEEGIDRINSLSRSMLDYAKEWRLELQRIALGDLLASACDLHRQTAADQGVALRCEASDGLPPVLCDPKLIHQAATDILVNAIDACAWKDYEGGETPEVVLRSFLADNNRLFVIEIGDNGCGMDNEIKSNIFIPFFSTKKTLGTGLGLALTDRIINVHGGKITVESEPDRGTAFRIYLPLDGPEDDKGAVDGQTSTHR